LLAEIGINFISSEKISHAKFSPTAFSSRRSALFSIFNSDSAIDFVTVGSKLGKNFLSTNQNILIFLSRPDIKEALWVSFYIAETHGLKKNPQVPCMGTEKERTAT
jgi:hypothetical protein